MTKTRRPTVSDRRVESAANEVLDQVEKAYEQVLPDGLEDSSLTAFDDQLDEAYRAYMDRTKRRPITPRQVQAAQRIFREDCRKAMREARDA